MFYVFLHCFLSIPILFSILAVCVCDESCREKIAPISPKGPQFVIQIGLCVHR